MTIKEITQLRKSGQIEEAFQAAESEFELNANKYTASALFWCLNDMRKLQTMSEASDSVERMQSLYQNYCEGDEYMQKTLESASKLILPHYKDLQDAVDKAKNGLDVSGTYRELISLLENDEINPQLYGNLGWLIYFMLKRTQSDDVQLRKALLYQYLKLELPRPSLLHSLILVEGIKVEQDKPLQFRIRDFIKLWGLENLREEDWEQFQSKDNNTLPSSVEKLIGVYAKELKTDNIVSPDDFSALVDQALVRYPYNQNMPYFKATVLLSQGKKEEALSYYKDLIIKYPSKFYLWHQASELIDDVVTKIGFLSKALTSGADSEYLGGVRLRMAGLMIERNLDGNARYELEKYQETYQAKGWKLKPEFWTMYNKVSTAVTAENNSNVYKAYSRKADDYIYGSLPETMAVKVSDKSVDDRLHSGKKYIQWTLRADNAVLRLKKPNRFGLDRYARNGSVFTVRIIEGKIVWIKPSEKVPADSWIKQVSGNVHLRKDRNGKKYAIINGVYVSERLLSDVSEGQNINVLALCQDDGRWSAISLIN